MGIVALLTAIVNLPATLKSLWDAIQGIIDRLNVVEKEKLIQAVQQTEKDTAAAQSDADYAKASADNAKNLGGF